MLVRSFCNGSSGVDCGLVELLGERRRRHCVVLSFNSGSSLLVLDLVDNVLSGLVPLKEHPT